MAVYEVRQIEGKGHGIVALKYLARGSLILIDKAILTVKSFPTDQAIEDAFQRLTKSDQTKYLSLYEGLSHSALESKVVRIFNSNHFGDNDGKWVFPLISRLNNSCVPNAIVADNMIYAQKNIQPGEEIEICYRESWDEVLIASQRNLLFKHRYGFNCTCDACLPTGNQTLSDQRRILIGAIRYALEGEQPTDFGRLISFNKANPAAQDIMSQAQWPPKVPSVQPVQTTTKAIEYKFLLARLREAEGLGSIRIGRAYVEAAGLLMELQSKTSSKHFKGNRILFVEAARCAVVWMQKAVEHSGYGEGRNSETTRLYKMGLQNLQRGDSISATTLALAGDDESDGDQSKKCYALLLDVGMTGPPKRLTYAQSEELFER